MSDKPREWWIYQSLHTGAAHFSDAPKDDVASLKFMNRVIEYSAYEAVKKQMDHNAKILNECVETERHIAVKFAMERDAVKKEFDTLCDHHQDLALRCEAERARSAKLVEALKIAQTFSSKVILSEFDWDYLCGKVFREALAEYEGSK